MRKFYLLSMLLACFFAVFCCEVNAAPKNKSDKKVEKKVKKEKKSKKKKESKKESKKEKNVKEGKNIGKFTVLTDFNAAKAASRASKKPILLVFSGSDWCPPCMKLDKEVFSTPVFRRWAEKNVIFMLSDNPRKKPLPPALKKQNQELRTTYNVTGVPTVLVLDYNGKVLAKTGYRSGGPQRYIRQLKVFVKKFR